MSTPTDFGYVPKYVMPVIPPPASGDPTTYYAGLGITVNATDNGLNGITYELITTATSVPAYSMTGGVVTYVPVGVILPDGSVSGGVGSLFLEPGIIDIQDLTKKLPLGVPAMTGIIYENVDDVSVRAALQPLVLAVDVKVLDKSWTETEVTDPATETLATKQAKYLDRIMAAEKFIPVDGGFQLGNIGTNVATNFEFTLRFIDGTGVVNVSPILYLRNMPVFDDPAKWTDHPLITSISAFTTPLDIYVKFEVWNPSSVDNPASATYMAVDANIEVKLMDYDILADDELASELTNSNGAVHFSLSALPTDADLYFKIINPTCASITEFALPSEWRTKVSGKFWNAKDGTPGYLPNFTGTLLGNAVNPVTFRIGLDYHLQVRYYIDSNTYNPVPEKVQVDLRAEGTLSSTLIKTNFTNKNGEVHDITFDSDPGDDLFYRIYFALEDPAINLQQTRIRFSLNNNGVQAWDTSDEGENILKYEDNSESSLFLTYGSLSNVPTVFTFMDDERKYAFYFLKTVKELHEFLFYFTAGAWAGREMNLDFYHIGGNTPTSFPNGNIWFTSDSSTWWNWETIIHEYSHQVMWQEADYSDDDIVTQFAIDSLADLSVYHNFTGLSTNERALTEGWADAIALIFALDFSIKFNNLHESSDGVLDPDPAVPATIDRGYRVEGAFASAIYSIFWDYVVADLNTTGQTTMTQTENGDLLSVNSFMTPANQADLSSRFISMIWQPLQKLSENSFLTSKTASEFVEYVKYFNSGITADNVWYKLRSEFMMWNMATTGFISGPSLVPTITSVFPNIGPDTGGNAIAITGTNYFVKNVLNGTTREVKLEIWIGPNLVLDSDVFVISETELQVTVPPGTAGVVDVKIGVFVRVVNITTIVSSNAYTYV